MLFYKMQQYLGLDIFFWDSNGEFKKGKVIALAGSEQVLIEIKFEGNELEDSKPVLFSKFLEHPESEPEAT